MSDDDKLSAIHDDLKLVKNLLTGNGSPEKGIIVRLDRIEQAEKRRTWLAKTTVTAAVSAVIASVASLFK